jgi:N-acetylmuramoyl-L-alanine amidase
MAKYHTVKQGEYLSKIARQYGFSDYRTIWDHAENTALKQKRQNPNVLFPGDRLYIPDAALKEVAGATTQRHHFQVQRSPLRLRLVLKDLYEEPIAHATCELRVENQAYALTTDGQGRLEQPIPTTAGRAFLVIKDPQTPLQDVVIPLKIGHLDPVEEISGQEARLTNLGYIAEPLEGKSQEEQEALWRSAVEEFQCDHGLEVDGKCGPQTQATLKQVHGC